MQSGSLEGELSGVEVRFPKSGAAQDPKKVTCSEAERKAVEAHQLPQWARRLELRVVPCNGESLFTATIRAFAAGMFQEEPPAWIQHDLFMLELQVRC